MAKSYWSVTKGDMRMIVPLLCRENIDAVICDPPYGLSKDPDPREVLQHWLAGDDYHHKGGGFMGKSWDSFVPGPSYWKVCYEALKPGGHLIAFGGSRTFDLLTMAIRLAGFEIRDSLQWLYGSGFPKSMDVSKAIDKAARGVPQGGADPTSVNHGKFKTQSTEGSRGDGDRGQGYGGGPGSFMAEQGERQKRELADDAQRWEGWGTALKPAYEPIILARKPLDEKTVAKNVLAHNTGALNIDATRIATGDKLGGGAEKDVQADKNGDGWDRPWRSDSEAQAAHAERVRANVIRAEALGRWPANVVLSHAEDCAITGSRVIKGDSRDTGGGTRAGGFVDTGSDSGSPSPNAPVYGDAEADVWECSDDCPVRLLDEQAGDRPSGAQSAGQYSSTGQNTYGQYGDREVAEIKSSSGGPSRFFYSAKVSKKERNAGLPEGLENKHPTLKPIEVMRWLARLVTPPGGLVLDPFCGSGSTGCAVVAEGFNFMGVELDEDGQSVAVARHRIAHWEKQREEIDV